MLEMKRFIVGADNLSYIFHEKMEAVLIDPGYDPSSPLSWLEEEGLDLRYVVLTHHHGDHSSSLEEVLKKTGARSVSSRYCSEKVGGVDIIVSEGSMLEVGDSALEFLETPGHTPGGICLITDGKYLVTGDTMFIGDCGRCDLPGGSIKEMFATLQRLKALPDDLLVLPGHDYGPAIEDTLGDQKRTSKVLLAKDLEDLSEL